MAYQSVNPAVVTQFGKPLVPQEWDIPTPGAGEILVETEACGVCRIFGRLAHGDVPSSVVLKFASV